MQNSPINFDLPKYLKNLEKRISVVENRRPGTIYLDKKIVAKDPVTGVETVIGDLSEYGEDRMGIKQWINDTEPPAVPVMPIVTSNLGVFSIVWSGFFHDDAPMAPDFSHLNVYGNDGTSTTLVGVIKTKDEVAIVTSDSEGMYDKNWSFWFTSVDQVGNESAPGVISSSNKLTPLVQSPDIQGAIDKIVADAKKDFEKAMLSANGKNRIWYTPNPPVADPNAPFIDGDMWFDTDNGNKIHVWKSTPTPGKWESAVLDSAAISQSILDSITNAQNTASKAQTSANGKNTNYYSTTAPTAPSGGFKVGDAWFDTDDANRVYVWTGTKWDPAKSSADIPQSVLDDILYAKGRADSAYTLANGKNKRVDSVSNPPSSVTNYIAGDRWLKWSNLGQTGKLLQSWTVKDVSGTLTWVLDSMDPTYLPKVDIGEGTFGSLNGDRLKVNSVSADRVLIGATDNVIPDPSFTNNASDWLVGTSTIYSFPTTEGRDGGSAIKITQTGTGQQLGRYSAKVPAIEGDTFRISVWVKCSVDAPASTLAVYVRNYLVGTTTSAAANIGQNKTLTANTWMKIEGTYKVPENTSHISFGVFKQQTLGASEVWFSDFSAIRMSGLTLIEDGAITTEKVKALELTVAKGTVSILDAGAISVGEMEGKYIKAGTVLASRLAVTDFLNYNPNMLSQAADWSLTGGTTITSSATSPDGKRFSFPLGSPISYAVPSYYSDVLPGDVISVRYTPQSTTSASVLELYWQSDSPAASGVLHTSTSSATANVSPVTIEFKVPANTNRIRFGLRTKTTNTAVVYAHTFVAQKMTSGTLIENGAVTTEKVKALELLADNGTIAKLDAGAINFGKMNGKYIEAGTIMASRVAITSVDNLNLDSLYADPDYWSSLQAGPGSGFVDPPVPNAPDTPSKVVLMTSKAQNSNMALYTYIINAKNRVSVEPGDFYSIWSYVMGDSDDVAMTTVSQQVYFYDASGTMLTGSLGNQSSGSITKASWTINQWNKVGGTKLIEVPAGAASMSPRLTVYKTANTEANGVKYYVAPPHITRATDGKLVVDGSITALSIAGDSIEARHIKTNAVTADKIEAGAVKTSHLAVGTGRELVGNGSGQLKNNNGFEGFTYVARAADVPVGHPGYFRSTAGQGTTNFLTGDNILRIKPNTKYRISVWVKSNVAGSKVYLEPMVGSTTAGERPIPSYAFSDLAVPTTWTFWESEIQTTGAPSGTMYFRWFLNHANGSVTNTMFYFTGFSVEEMIEGTVISNGAITTSKIAANSITAEKMTIGVGTNLFPDPQVKDVVGWIGSTGISVVDKGGRTLDTNALRITDNTSGSTYTYYGYNSGDVNRRFRVTPGRSYKVTSWIKPSVDTTVGSNIRYFARIYNQNTPYNGTYSWAEPSYRTAEYLTEKGIIPSTSWTKFEQTFTVPETAEGFYFCLGLYLAGGFPNGQYVDWTDISVTEMMSGELIVDGAIDSQIITGAILQTHKADRTGVKLTPEGLQVYDTEGSQTVSITPGSGVDYMGFFGRPVHRDQYIGDDGWIFSSLDAENYVFFKPRTDGDPFAIGSNVRFKFKAKYFVDPDNPTKTSMPVNANIWTYPESSWGDTAGNKRNYSATFTVDTTEREFDVTIPITALATNYQSWISGLQAMDGTAYNEISIQDRVGIKDVVSYIDGVEVELNPRQHQAGVDRRGELLGQQLKVMGDSRLEGTLVINGDPMDGHGSGDYGPVYMGRDLLGATYTNFFNDNHGESGSAWLTPMPHGLLSNSYHNGWNGTTTNYWTVGGNPGEVQVLTHLRDTVEIKNGRGYLITYTTPAFKVTDGKEGSPGACVLKYAEGRTLGVDSGSAVHGSRYYLSGGPDFDNPGRTVYVVGGQDLPIGDVTIGVEIYVYDNRKIQSTGTADARYWSLNILDVGSAVKGSTGNSQGITKKRPISTEPAPVDPPPPPKPPAKKTYTKTWNASWWGTWWVGNGNGRNSGLDKDGKVAQGKPPGVGYRQRGAVGFPDMKSTVDGSGTTIKKVELYVYAAHWYSSGGGTLQIGTHSHTSKPGTWSGGTTGLKNQKLAKPEGRWITLPTTVHAGIKSGSVKGIQVYTTSTSSSYYGYLTGSRTKMRITYEK